jgi:hypothetical protein
MHILIKIILFLNISSMIFEGKAGNGLARQNKQNDPSEEKFKEI